MNQFKHASTSLGLDLNDNDDNNNTSSATNVKIFEGVSFWCGNSDNVDVGISNCCFNHIIGLPTKDGEKKPLFPYEMDVYKAWEHNLHLWIKKATGLGISEFFLRLMLWLCLRNNDYQGCQMCIVTGPNIDLAKKLIKRMRDLIIDYPGFRFNTMTDYVLEVNHCWIQAYPSHNLGSFRSLDKAKFILIDEGDFFPVGQLEEIRHVSERYIAKSNPWIIMVSTPNSPGGLFESIENEPDSQCLYHRMFLDYKQGLGLIYTQKDIEKAKQSPGFEREYNLKYGFGLGNVFLPNEIENCCNLINYPIQPNFNCSISCGVDPGWGSSKTAVSVIQLEDSILKIIFCQEFERPSYENMLNLISKLRVTYRPQKIYVDGSAVDFCKSLKGQFNEAQDYDRIMKQATHDKINYWHRMSIVPVNFNTYGPELLQRLQHFISRGQLAFNAVEHKDLVLQLRMARFKENGNLDKDLVGGNTFDALDATRLAVFQFYTGAKR